MASRQPHHRNCRWGSLPFAGQSIRQRFIVVLILLAAWVQVACDPVWPANRNQDGRTSNGPIATQLTPIIHVVESNVSVPTVIARVGCIDSRAWEPIEISSGMLGSDQDRAVGHELSDDLAVDGFDFASHLTLVNLNVRLQI